MKPRILLVNPPVYDFAAYDFWLKPYGMLSVAGKLRGRADFVLFDYMDRQHPFIARQKQYKSDKWGRGTFYYEKITKPHCLDQIPRYYRRYGLPQALFTEFLKKEIPFDYAFIQTTMTYWYPGVQEVIQDIRKFHPNAKIILGGVYATLCRSHAETIGADSVISGINLEPLWDYMKITPDLKQPALWEVYNNLNTGILKLTDGCPFSCTYCSVQKVYGKFKPRDIEHSFAELEFMTKLGVQNVAFYDDALLYKPEEVLIPFLEKVIKNKIQVNFHTPNALNARFITSDLANIMIHGGFKTFYLGFESSSVKWQNQTGSKVFSEELVQAVEYLKKAGANLNDITAYQILGHPNADMQELEESMDFVHSLGIRGMLADFSPIPGTPDGESCRNLVNLDEPLMHNKTAFPIIMMGFDESNRLKDLQRHLNRY